MKQTLNLAGNIYEFEIPNCLDAAERHAAALEIDIKDLGKRIQEVTGKNPEAKKKRRWLLVEKLRLNKELSLIKALMHCGRTRVERELNYAGFRNTSKIVSDPIAQLYELHKLYKRLCRQVAESGQEVLPTLTNPRRAVEHTVEWTLQEHGYFQLIQDIESEKTDIQSALEESETKAAREIIEDMQKSSVRGAA